MPDHFNSREQPVDETIPKCPRCGECVIALKIGGICSECEEDLWCEADTDPPGSSWPW